MDNIKALALALAPKMNLGRREPGSRKVLMEDIDILLPIEEKNSPIIGRVSKSIESLSDCITRLASYLDGFDEIAAEDAYRIRFKLNSRIVAILIGTRLHKQEKDGLYVFKSFFLTNSLPNKSQIFDICRLYDRYSNEIAVKFNINDHSPDEISNIAPTINDRLAVDFENVTEEKLQDTIRYILNKHLTINDLLMIVIMAERLRARKRLKAFGIALFAVALGGAYFIYKKGKSGNESNNRKMEDKTNGNNESNDHKILEDKTSEDDLTEEEEDYLNNFEYGEEWLDREGKLRNMSIEEYEEIRRIEDYGLDEILKDKTPTDDLSQRELDYIRDCEYWEEYLERDDELYDMSIMKYEEMRSLEDYGLDDDEMDCGD